MHCYSDGLCQDGATSTEYSQFNTFEDVQHNLGKLGQRKKIFIWFVPSKHAAHAGALEARIFLFSRHLVAYGFDVLDNLATTMSHASEDDRASRTDYEMSHADWIICVCSQSLYAMFNNATDPSEIHSLNTKVTFSNRTLYNRLLNDTALKVIPVILLHEDDDLLFVPPTLRDPKNIMRIFEDTPFNIYKLDGDLERLICRMAGINRMAIRLADNDHHNGHRNGFVKLPSKIPQVDVGKNPIQQENNFVNGINGGYQRSHPWPHYNYHQQDIHLQQSTRQPFHNHYPYNNHLQQSAPPQLHYNHLQQMVYSPQPSINCPPKQNGTQYNASRSYNPIAGSTACKPVAHNGMPQANNQCAKRQQLPINVNSLPRSKIPPNSPILWELSQGVMEWKFLGRNLDMEEEMINEIDYNTVPNKTREKALKVLTEWVNSSAPTWETLGRALMDAEYILLYEKLLELFKRYQP